MNYNDVINKITDLIRNKKYDEAEKELLAILEEVGDIKIEDEKSTKYTFNNYTESILYYHMNKYKKENKLLDINLSEIYYRLGFINYEKNNYGKALEFQAQSIKWNPLNVEAMLERASIYSKIGDLERSRAQLEKAHKYIYRVDHLSKYYRELGWYYSERRIFDVANALYTKSIEYINTELALNELKYIAKIEKREPKYSTKEEINYLFEEFNIPKDFNHYIVDSLYYELEHLKKESKYPIIINELSSVLYNITLDKQFLVYNLFKNDKYGIQINIPNMYKQLSEDDYEKYDIKNNTILAFLDHMQKICVSFEGKCTFDQLGEKYKDCIKEFKDKKYKIIKEYTIRGNNNINQAFIEYKDEKIYTKYCVNYLIINDNLYSVLWDIPNYISNDNIFDINNKSYFMDILFSLKDIDKQETPIISVQEVSNIEEKNKDIELKAYYQEIKGYPTFKFYFPKDLGNIEKYNDYVFEIKKENIQKMRIAIIKCKEEEFEKNAKDWIEKTRSQNNQEIDEYSQEKINEFPIERYVLKSDKGVKRIYKIGYVNGYKITISGEFTKRSEQMVNLAFQKIEWEVNKIKEGKSNNSIKINCPICNKDFELNWKVPSSEKTFYCKCPNCNAEIKKENPNYKGE